MTKFPIHQPLYPGKNISDRLFAVLFLCVGAIPFLMILLIHGLLFTEQVFFVQERIYSNGENFRIHKLKTLYPKKNLQTLHRFWLKLIRTSSMDEFPQLIQVLSGKMALVGPRPLVPEFRPYIEKFLPERFNIKPGLTGWAQVNGGRSLTLAEKLKLDKEYITKANLRMDLIIIFRTLGHWSRKSSEDARDLQELEQWRS